MPADGERDDRYFALIKSAVTVCKVYRPMFGGGRSGGLSVDQFQALYRTDPFYTWFGLDSPLVYAAHKAAGGITSLYRQIGIACERLFRQLLQDSLGLTPEEAVWTYSVPTTTGKTRTLALDGRIPLAAIADAARARKVRDWMLYAAEWLKVPPKAREELQGPVFEVRQGYKSKDSKRQNADIGNAANAYANNYLPVLALMSSQIDGDVAERYLRAQWLILRGAKSGTALDSTFIFSTEVLGYDLAGFFERNSSRIRLEVEAVIEALLK